MTLLFCQVQLETDYGDNVAMRKVVFLVLLIIKLILVMVFEGFQYLDLDVETSSVRSCPETCFCIIQSICQQSR